MITGLGTQAPGSETIPLIVGPPNFMQPTIAILAQEG